MRRERVCRDVRSSVLHWGSPPRCWPQPAAPADAPAPETMYEREVRLRAIEMREDSIRRQVEDGEVADLVDNRIDDHLRGRLGQANREAYARIQQLVGTSLSDLQKTSTTEDAS